MHTGGADVWEGAPYASGLGVRVAPQTGDCWWARTGLIQVIERASEYSPLAGQGGSRGRWSPPEAGVRRPGPRAYPWARGQSVGVLPPEEAGVVTQTDSSLAGTRGGSGPNFGGGLPGPNAWTE